MTPEYFIARRAAVAADPRYQHPGPGRWWWMSFCDRSALVGEQFLGVCIVEADHLPGAIDEAWKRRINPGGEIQSAPLITRVPREKWRNRLLTRAECARAEADAVDAEELARA